MSIYVTKPSIPDFEEYIEEIRPIFENRVLTNMGPLHKKFEKQLIEYLQVDNISLFVNGHQALELGIQGLGLKSVVDSDSQGEVITTPFTFVSTTHAIARNNLKPVFCDISSSDYCIDTDMIEKLITDKTVAIMPVHVYGNVCNVEKIEEIAQKHGLKVFYDGAHTFGEKYKGLGIGNFGDATAFSFHATKAFNTIEGGAVTFKDERFKTQFHELKNFGIHSEEIVAAIGGNAKMDEFRAAMGLCNLRNIDKAIQSRKAVDARYRERLSGIPGVKLNAEQPGVERNYAYFPVYFDREILGYTRDDVYRTLKEKDIYSRKYFYPAVNDLECYKDCNHDTPVARNVSLNILCLPIYEGLTRDEVDSVCNIILNL